jgi:hypothetical protein
MKRSHGQSGYSRTQLYETWIRMRSRCNNPNDQSYAHYGGRGIKVCRRWNSYEKFALDIGERPTPKHTLERRNNNGDYKPSNCCWATRDQQSRNRRVNKLSMKKVIAIHAARKAGGKLQDIADRFGVSRTHIKLILADKKWRGVLR